MEKNRINYISIAILVGIILFSYTYLHSDIYYKQCLYDNDADLQKVLYQSNKIKIKSSDDYFRIAELYNKNLNYTMSNMILDEMYLTLDLNKLAEDNTLKVLSLMFDNYYSLKEYYRCSIIGKEYIDYYTQSKDMCIGNSKDYFITVFSNKDEEFEYNLSFLVKYIESLLEINKIAEALELLETTETLFYTGIFEQEKIIKFYSTMSALFQSAERFEYALMYLEKQSTISPHDNFNKRSLVYCYVKLFEKTLESEKRESIKSKIFNILNENEELFDGHEELKSTIYEILKIDFPI